MAVITRLFSRGTDETIVRQAPPNKVFLVEAINVVFQGFTNNTLYILNRHLKPGRPRIYGLMSTNETPSLLAVFKQNSVGSDHSFFVGQINDRTKYISVAYENTNTINFGAVIYGQIVSETKSNLIWEFITKRAR